MDYLLNSTFGLAARQDRERANPEVVSKQQKPFRQHGSRHQLDERLHDFSFSIRSS
jgi:hypothetical protein